MEGCGFEEVRNRARLYLIQVRVIYVVGVGKGVAEGGTNDNVCAEYCCTGIL